MASGRKKGDHDARRVEIAEAACKVILRSGLERVGIADVAREMGCSTGVLMHYYASKAQMLLFAKNLLFDRAYERMKRIEPGGDASETLLAIARELLPLTPETIGRCRVLCAFTGLAVGNPPLIALQGKRDLRFSKLFADTIADLQSLGLISKKLDAAAEGQRMSAFIDGICSQAAMNPRSWPPSEVTAAMQSYIQRIIGAP